MGLFSKKDPCAICGGKVSGLFPAKVEGHLICKECYGTVDIDQDLPPLTLEQFKAYRAFRTENQKLKEGFCTTEKVHLGFFNTDFLFDLDQGLFSLDPTLERTIFPGKAIRSFRILEDDSPLYEGSAQGIHCYVSDVPERVEGLAPLIEQYRMQVEMERSLDRMREEPRRDPHDAPPPPPPQPPLVDLPEPFERFRIEIEVEHPYWKVIRAEKKGPTFDSFRPDAGNYLHDYWEDVELMERLASCLREVAFPGAPVQNDNDAADATSTAADAPAVETDVAAEIKKYKELLDQELITEAEFTTKKHQLLGL